MSVKKCSKCKVVFRCGNEAAGCWCEQFYIDMKVLEYLKKEYLDCLCPICLKEFSLESEKNNS